MIKLFSLFSGIGAFEKALERLRIPFELIGFSEVDKFAIKSYCAIHDIPESKNYGDITKINENDLPDFDMMTWGFPCQDISIAGKMKGIEKGKTRSGLYYEGYRILKAKKPKYSIIENVKNLTSKRFKEQFESILKDLSDLGYTNYWKMLNAKDYGIPQNRERVFIISIRNDIAQNNFSFPPKVPLLWKLKDFLEDNVDEKYYLSDKGVGRIINKSNRLVKNSFKNPEVSSCIIAGYHKMDGRDNQYIPENKVRRISGIFNSNGLSSTLTTMNKDGNKQPFIIVREATQKGYSEAKIGDSINISYPNNLKKRGRVGKGISQRILTSPNMAVVENTNKPIRLNKGKNVSAQNRIYDTNGIATTVTASGFRTKIADIAPTQKTSCGSTTSKAAVLISEDGKTLLRIRKLTPLEVWRLMGFDDVDFYKAKLIGISDTQLYKQAGNSIVVNV